MSPLFEIDGASGELAPFRRLSGSSELYEEELQKLIWDNPEEFAGEPLFRVAQMPSVAEGGKPDIVALDRDARVVVIEIKRDVDRNQLAQCLEYAGWARGTNLDELAGIYYLSPEQFFDDWKEFTESDHPQVVNPQPRLILIARDFDGRTSEALEFLEEFNLPLLTVPVTIYEDADKRRFVDVDSDHEPELSSSTSSTVDHTKIAGRRVRISDLLDAGLLEPGAKLVWVRPRVGESYEASVTQEGAIQLPDGRIASTPSRAGILAADVPAIDGWFVWGVEGTDKSLDDLRRDLAEK